MRIRDLTLMSAIILGISVYAIAKSKDDARRPASLPMRNGVICGQGQAVNAAEMQLNEKLGGASGEPTLLLKGRFESISNPRITAVTMTTVPTTTSGQVTYVLCAAVSGD